MLSRDHLTCESPPLPEQRAKLQGPGMATSQKESGVQGPGTSLSILLLIPSSVPSGTRVWGRLDWRADCAFPSSCPALVPKSSSGADSSRGRSLAEDRPVREQM